MKLVALFLLWLNPLQEMEKVGGDDLNEQIDRFAERIRVEDDESIELLRDAMKTKAGKVVLRDRIAKKAQAIREREEAKIVAAYFRAYFADSDEGLNLKEGNEYFKEKLLDLRQGKKDYDKALAGIQPLITKVGRKLTKGEASDLFKSFLLHEGGAHMTWNWLRRQRRRGDTRNMSMAELLQWRFNRGLVKENDDGTFTLLAVEEFPYAIRNWLKQHRNKSGIRKAVLQHSGRIADKELKSLYGSEYGVDAIFASNEGDFHKIARTEFDGFTAWTKEWFQRGEGGHRLRGDARPAVRTYLAQVEKVMKELEQDDFEDDED